MRSRKTPAVDKWLRENYSNYTAQQMGECLTKILGVYISTDSIYYWLRQLNLRRTEYNGLTLDQMIYIRANYGNETALEMSIELEVPQGRITSFIHREGIKKPAPSHRKKNTLRPKADHQNMSREDHVQKWLDMPDPVLKNKIAY